MEPVLEVCMRCSNDRTDPESSLWLRGCMHSVCDSCYETTEGRCPLALCIGGDNQCTNADILCYRQLLNNELAVYRSCREPEKPKALWEQLAELSNPVAIFGGTVYCVNALEDGTPTIHTDDARQLSPDAPQLYSADFATQSVLLKAPSGRVFRLQLDASGGRVTELEREEESFECPPTFLSLGGPWYVFDMDQRCAVPILRVAPRTEVHRGEAHHEQNWRQLRVSIESRIKQIEWLQDAREQLQRASDEARRLPEDHPFRRQLVNWRAAPVELSLYPHELTAHEQEMVEGDGIYIGNWTHARVTRDEVIHYPPHRDPRKHFINLVRDSASPADISVMCGVRVIAKLTERGAVAVAYDSATNAVLITTRGRALLKFYYYMRICF